MLRTDWRASTFHAATLDLLERIEITGQMLAEGLTAPVYQFRDRVEGLVASFDFRLLSDETRHPYRLQLNQQHLVRMPYQRLRGAYPLGADGAASTMRQALGVRFEGYTYPERFMIASTTVNLRELIPDLADVNYVADPRKWLFILRTPESWRAVWPVPAGQSWSEATSPPAGGAGSARTSPKRCQGWSGRRRVAPSRCGTCGCGRRR